MHRVFNYFNFIPFRLFQIFFMSESDDEIVVPVVTNRDLVAVFSRRKVQKLLRRLTLGIPVIVRNKAEHSKKVYFFESENIFFD